MSDFISKLVKKTKQRAGEIRGIGPMGTFKDELSDFKDIISPPRNFTMRPEAPDPMKGIEPNVQVGPEMVDQVPPELLNIWVNLPDNVKANYGNDPMKWFQMTSKGTRGTIGMPGGPKM
jgi:hypothetical protein